MVARIMTRQSIRAMLQYNHNKVNAGDAVLIMGSGFAADVDRLTFGQLLHRFQRLTELNTRVQTNSETYLSVDGAGKVQPNSVDMDNFLYVLNPYYKGGEFDYLLNATENLDLLHQPLVVFEIDQCKNHPILFPVVTIIIMELFISKMRKLKGVRKVLLLEEVWKSIAKENFADYILYLFKTVRKFFGEAIVVTQEIEDILSSPIVKKAIIGNADCKILLDQRKYQSKFDEVQALLGLNEHEKALVLSMNRANDPKLKYKEVFISLGSGHSRVYRTEVSLEEYLCYSTEEREKIKVQEYAARNGGIARGVQMLAADLRRGVKVF